MIRVLFEDTIDCFPFILLQRILNEKLMGSKGNNNLAIKLTELRSDCVAYMDVIPDNIATIRLYSSAVEIAKKLNNVYVFPIPNIEYIFIYAFLGYQTTESGVALDFGNYTKCLRNDKGKPLSTVSFEYFCKSILKNARGCHADRRFENNDCLCNPYMESKCQQLTLNSKSLRLLYSLPAFKCILNPNMFLENKEYINREANIAVDRINKAVTLFTEYGIARNIKLLDYPEY